MFKKIIMIAFSCSMTLLSITSHAQLRKGVYERMDENIASAPVKAYRLKDAGQFEIALATLSGSSLTGAIIASGSYTTNNNVLSLSNGESFKILDDCRFSLGEDIYYQQACKKMFNRKTVAYLNGTLYMPNSAILTDFIDYKYVYESYDLEFKIVSGEPLRFELTKAEHLADNDDPHTAIYSLMENNPDYKFRPLNVLYVNEKDHLLKYGVTLKQISSDPYVFEVSLLYLDSARDFHTNKDVTLLYRKSYY